MTLFKIFSISNRSLLKYKLSRENPVEKFLSMLKNPSFQNVLHTDCHVSTAETSGILHLRRINCHLNVFRSSFSHLCSINVFISSKESYRFQYILAVGLLGAISCQYGRLAEFNFFSKVGVMSELSN